MALGEMLMTEAELEAITPRSLFNKLKGFRIAQRDDWERTRAQAYLLLSPHFEKNATVAPKDVMTFPWDVDTGTTARPDPKKMAEERKKGWEKIDRTKKK